MRLVYGVGINDANYITEQRATEVLPDGSKIRRLLWRCPFYRVWSEMLRRCYSETWQVKHPTYVGCSTVEEWKTFSEFKAWMEQQDWEGMALDKDILSPGNKQYGPKYCIFVSQPVNNFILDSARRRGEYPIGVSFDVCSGKYQVHCSNPFTKRQESLGRFSTQESAHIAWAIRKYEHASQLAALQTDARLSSALLDRYELRS